MRASAWTCRDFVNEIGQELTSTILNSLAAD
jgi:hypothetical protein